MQAAYMFSANEILPFPFVCLGLLGPDVDMDDDDDDEVLPQDSVEEASTLVISWEFGELSLKPMPIGRPGLPMGPTSAPFICPVCVITPFTGLPEELPICPMWAMVSILVSRVSSEYIFHGKRIPAYDLGALIVWNPCVLNGATNTHGLREHCLHIAQLRPHIILLVRYSWWKSQLSDKINLKLSKEFYTCVVRFVSQ